MLAEILHELIDAAAIAPYRRGELHALLDQMPAPLVPEAERPGELAEAAATPKAAPTLAKSDVPAGA